MAVSSTWQPTWNLVRTRGSLAAVPRHRTPSSQAYHQVPFRRLTKNAESCRLPRTRVDIPPAASCHFSDLLKRTSLCRFPCRPDGATYHEPFRRIQTYGPRGSLPSEAAFSLGAVQANFADGPIGVQNDDTLGDGLADIVFLGTGTSEGVPRVSCLTDPTKKCQVCWSATLPGNRNRRRNTSVVIRWRHLDGRQRTILIDAGKFFYHSAMQWFPYHGIRHLDAVIITHSHADAIGGLDDLRDWTNNIQERIPIYVAQRDLEVMGKTHYYLVDSSGITPGTAVSSLSFHTISEDPFVVEDLKVTPLPVWHGKGYRSLGFRVGNTAYISDASEIPEETYPLLENCDLLVLDALRPDKSSTTHFGLPAALAEIRKIRPKKTLFTGMMHVMDHDKVNQSLALLLEKEGLDVSLSYDGQRVPIAL